LELAVRENVKGPSRVDGLGWLILPKGCGCMSEKWLVGGVITILKNMKVNGKDYPIYYGK